MKKVLVLGGTRFFGKRLVEQLLASNMDVTIATSGRTPNPFGKEVKHIPIERFDKNSLKLTVASNEWDMVYDQLCFAPSDAADACEIFKDRVGLYVVTSSIQVYDKTGIRIREDGFNPNQYLIRMGRRSDSINYAEGKRLAEAVFSQTAAFPVVAVRFPVVLGIDDYTKRLHFYVKRILNHELITVPPDDTGLSLISSHEAARFLLWTGQQSEMAEPINACSLGEKTIMEIILMIESIVDTKAIIQDSFDSDLSPLGNLASLSMDNGRALAKGFEFSIVDDWLLKLISSIAREYE